MKPPTISVALALAENATAITAWRATLSEKERRRLRDPQSNVKHWKAETQSNGKHHVDPITAAETAWKHFTASMDKLPRDAAVPLWRAIHHHAQQALTQQ